LNITNLVLELTKELHCSKSTTWTCVSTLKKSNFLIYGSLKDRGIPVKLTQIGKIISKSLENIK